MLPFALKVSWFVLSLTGLLSSLVGLPRFWCALDCLWIPVTYGAANVVLQVMFCLGMIWKMDPYLMPHPFCIAQAALRAIPWFVMTSLCAAMSIMTSLAILRAHGTRVLSVLEIQRALRPRPALLSLVTAFPVLSFIAYIAVSLKFHAVQPSDDMTCDVSNPVWVRLLSFAGVPLLLAVPSFVLSCTCALCLLLSRRHPHDRSHSPHDVTSDIFSPLPGRREFRDKRHSLHPADSLADTSLELKVLSSLTSLPSWDVSRRAPSTTPPPSLTLHAIPSPPRTLSAGASLLHTGRAPITSAEPYAKHFHLPFSWKPPPSRSSPESDRHRAERFSFLSQSPSPMMFAPPSTASSARTSPTGLPVFPSFPSFGARAASAPACGEVERASPPGVVTGYEDIEVDTMSGSLRWARGSDTSSTKSDIEFMGEPSEGQHVNELEVWSGGCSPDHSLLQIPPDRDSASALPHLPLHPDSVWDSPPDPPPPPQPPQPAHSSPLVWRILFFQLFLSSTQILAAVSSLVDMFSGRDIPTPFGTQHVALILAAWAPSIAFGILPWRRKAR